MQVESRKITHMNLVSGQEQRHRHREWTCGHSGEGEGRMQSEIWLDINTLCVLVAQSWLTLCNPMDCSPPGSSVHGILQARTLEWVAMPFSRGSFQPGIKLGSPALQADSLSSEPWGKPQKYPTVCKIDNYFSYTRNCYIAQRAQLGAPKLPRWVGWGERWKGGPRRRGCMYVYNWFISLYGRK